MLLPLNCIFCGALLDENTPPEHLIPAALGGRKSSTTIVCGGCNHRFGDTIDAALVADLDVVRCNWDVKKTRGRRLDPPTLRGLKSEDGMELEVRPGGIAVAAQPFTIEPADSDDAGSGAFRVESRGMDETVLALMHILRRQGIAGDADIRKHLSIEQARNTTSYAGAITFNTSIGGAEPARAVAKTALEFFATLRRQGVHHPSLDEARAFVLCGDPQATVAHLDFGTRVVLPFSSEELGPAHHQVTVWSCGAGQPLVGSVTLFGHLHWSVLLSDTWEERFSSTHAVDPLAGVHLNVRDGEPLTLPSDWRAARLSEQSALDGVVAAFEELRALWYQRQNDRVIHALVVKAFEKVRDHVDSEGCLTPLGTRLMINEVADAAAHHHFRVSRSTQLDIDEIISRVVAEYPGFCDQFER
jgi:hypothetical protein